MDTMEWLGTWEQLDSPGRHSRMAPADGACGYPAPYHGQILRAIPVTGTVRGRPSWENSPQVKFWLDEPKKTILERIMDWLKE